MSRWMKILALPLAATLIMGACSSDDDTDATGGDDNGDSSGETISGDVEVDGSSTVAPLAEVAADLFMEANPDARVSVATSGTGGGFEKFCNGESDFNDASRPIKDEEIEACEANDIQYENVEVANDALAVVVNPDNPVDCMTVEQISQMWDEGSTVATWGDVDGLDVGDFGSEPATLYGPGTDSGTFDFFTEVINGEEGQIRDDYTSIGEDDQAAITAVEGDVAAMGFVPFSFFSEAGDSIKPLNVDDGSGCVEPTLDNVQNGSYTPLGRPLFSYASNAALEKPQAVAFISFWIDNSDEVAEIAGFVPLTQEQKDASLAQVESLQG